MLLVINKKPFSSCLMLGTGKYQNLKQAQESIALSEASIVTVAIRRAQRAKIMGQSNLIDGLNWKKLWLLPNTAGCKTAEEAIRVAFLGKEIAKYLGQVNNNFIKLEVIPDPKYLLPDPIGTLKAAEYLVHKNFTVMPYINADPLLAKQLENIGCSTVMPLASPIGSGNGLQNKLNIQIIIENSNIPVIVDAGIGTPSEACHVMELGASGVLLNTAIAKSSKPQLMAEAMKYSIISGRMAYLAGRMEKSLTAKPSSPIYGTLNT
uniref:Thiamine biosynthesis protein G n=1 Tax=Hypnea brasiliensis TaxID=1866962 RepID=UPI0023EFD73B|nr:Thiamine biosynthesis protein G [Hypnea brasiliensis]WCH55235.1 Thiamine biosynthesis protein G [Hypnea brasiliensis]WDY84783.1 Thiamine biosynthesis protein G [Hypnea brasiliensis]